VKKSSFPNTATGNVTRNVDQGFSLIELLVGMVIGLFLLLGLSTYFVQSKQTFAYQKSQINQQEHERILAILMGRSVHQAGYSPVNTNRLTGQEIVFPAAGTYAAGQFIAGTQATHDVTVNGQVAAVTYPDDTLSVRYIGDPSLARCDGTVPATDVLVADTVSVDGVQFICDIDGATQTPLFGGVNVPLSQQIRVLGMAVTYGVDTDADTNVDSIVRAGGVTDWTQVRIAELEIHFQSGNRLPQATSLVIALENSIGVDLL
jgi:type IV pilus assembly protein PilW